MELSQDEIEGFKECVDVNTVGMVRVSFGIYNTADEVDEFFAGTAQGAGDGAYRHGRL